jgi:hypothetical protein
MADKKETTTAEPGVNPKAVRIGGESLADRIVPHIKKILVMVIMVAVAISVILVIRWRGEVNKERQTEKLLTVLEVARTPVGPAQPEIPGMPKKKDAPKPFPTQKERAEAMLAAMESSGSKPVSSFKGGVLLDAGRIDDAIAEYRTGLVEKGIEGVLNREGLGIALEAKAMALPDTDTAGRKKLFEEALAVYATMQPDPAGPRYVYALYHQGRVLQNLEKVAEAKAMFEKAKPLAAAAEPETRDPRTDAQLLSAIIDRRLSAM